VLLMLLLLSGQPVAAPNAETLADENGHAALRAQVEPDPRAIH
jgi:hypothetical protein